MSINHYQYKLEKYKKKFQEIQSRKQHKIRLVPVLEQSGGNCKYFINHASTELSS